MIGALWTGISGLAGQQTALDNESNNIANVNTIGYKASRISFADQMYQDKIGKGTTILDAEKLYKQGNLKLTGVSYDMALSGDGFFAVADASNSAGTAETYYTRAGNFRMGDNGKLQDAAGNEVQGWAMSTLDPAADVTTTNSNITRFTDDYNKLAASQIVKRSTSVETITAKMTDYTAAAKADDLTVMTGAGYKTKSTKISDVELLISSYSSKLASYAATPDATSTPSVAQNSYIDFNLDGNTADSGDQIYVYINGTKYAQTFETNEKVTLQKLTDQLSNIPGINAYIGDTISATEVSTTILSNNPINAIIIEGLVPGDTITIGDAGIVHDNTNALVATGTNTAAVAGTGYGAVLSASEALKVAVAGEQRDVWGGADVGAMGTDDKIKYSLTVGLNTYTVEIEEGQTSVTTDTADTTATVLGAASSDATKIADLVTAINSHSEMAKTIKATEVNGNLVIETLTSGVEFSGALTVDYFQDAAIVKGGTDGGVANTIDGADSFQYDMSGVLNTDEEIQFEITTDGTAYKIYLTGDSKAVKVFTGATPTDITLSATVTSGNAAAMLAEVLEQIPNLKDDVVASTTAVSTRLDLSDQGDDASAITLTYGTNGITRPDGSSSELLTAKNFNSDYSVNAGTGAEFMQIKTTIDQTASKGGLQLRLDTLGISNSAFGDFNVDDSGLITMKQDGAEFAIGQVAIALFNDNRGLEPMGDNKYGTTTRSGAAIYNINNNKTAAVKSKTLELSTADLSESLVNLMVFQRAFEANAKSITTADSILNTLINLKR